MLSQGRCRILHASGSFEAHLNVSRAMNTTDVDLCRPPNFSNALQSLVKVAAASAAHETRPGHGGVEDVRI